ncbi:F0F1 ATP synthase subunit alpha [Candidatus Nomurabacteria bacterium]|nr:F0F1 ATP synthase subunit alpha [Candidatus Nomurabacteria bacterium]USN94965.1 MAG: F0F1 ATP synthase subunit alpha [Candidatus Nomurabacteria bacterium]
MDTFINKIKQKIENFEPQISENEFGEVVSVRDGIAKISGLPDCMASEIIEFESGEKGIALNLEEDYIGAIILGEGNGIKEGNRAKRTGKILSLSVGDGVLGRVLNALGEEIDGKGSIQRTKEVLIERIAPGVIERKPVDQPLSTGIKAIDSMIPVGRGQRELIIGDRQTGKTTIALDTIINQKGQDVICIYVSIGQKNSKVSKIVADLEERGALDYTVVVSASAGESPSNLYLAPYTGVAIAEYFMGQGKDVLIIYDDLTKHAIAYREISLLLRRPPGREAFPGDVFYLHSRLLERACRIDEKYGGGSITALPIIETQAGDVSGYIPTNVISITDGQIFLETNLFYKGVRPAINPGLSVSRVGGSAQIKSMKKNAGTLKLTMAQYRELESFAQFDSDLDPETKKTIERGKRITEMLKQNEYSPIKTPLQVVSIFAMNEGYFDEVKVEDVKKKESELSSFMENRFSDLLKEIQKDWNDEIKQKLVSALEEFKISA